MSSIGVIIWLVLVYLMEWKGTVGMCAGRDLTREDFCERDGGEMIEYEVCVVQDSVLWRVQQWD